MAYYDRDPYRRRSAAYGGPPPRRRRGFFRFLLALFRTLVTIVFITIVVAGAAMAGMYLRERLGSGEAASAPEAPPAGTEAGQAAATPRTGTAAAEAALAETPYDAIYTALAAYETEITFADVPEDVVIDAYYAVLDDHPELFWAASGCAWTSYTGAMGTTIVLEPMITDSREDILWKEQRLWEAAEDILGQLTPDMTTYDKVLFIHDYIVEHTSYDRQAALTANDGTPPEAANAYGCLVGHSAICSGYSRAFQLMMRQLGVECLRVTGLDAETGGDHEWNCVRLDGDYYYIDVTWDDPTHSDGSAESLEHDYFCITTDELLMTHVIDPDQDAPLCTAIQGDYYRQKRLYLGEYDFDDMAALIQEHLYEPVVEMKFAAPGDTEAALADLFEAGLFYDIPGVVQRIDGGVRYSVGRAGLVLKIVF